MKIAIMGGHGFVGKSVTQKLSGHNPSTHSRRDGLDLRDYAATRDLLLEKRPEVIVNLASHGGSLHYVTEKAADVIHDNLLVALNLYRAVSEACPDALIVNPIANCSYPGDSDVQTESRYWDGPVHESVWAFGNSRRAWITIADCYKTQYSTKSVNLVFPNAYGPGDYDDPNKAHALTGMVLRMLDAQAAGESSFEIWGTGKPIREWIYVDDIAKIITEVIERKTEITSGINVAQNYGLSIGDLASLIKDAVGFDGELVFNPKYQDGAPVKQLDDERFRTEFPDFEFTSFEDGLKETISYYRSIGRGA